MRFFLLLALLGLAAASAALAQTPAHRLARYRYYEANPDSLRQVLATQRTDTARLRTLMHLLDRGLNHAEGQQVQVLTSGAHGLLACWLPLPSPFLSAS
jgi:hypothetical protein